MARELEQFLGRGEEAAFWILTYKNVGSAILGGFMGSRVGQLMGTGGIVMLLSVVGVALGLGLSLNRRGLMWGRRLWLALLFYLRSAIKPRMIDAGDWYRVIEEREHAVGVRQAGQLVVAPRRMAAEAVAHGRPEGESP
ncbi:hypothetical protein Haur_5241 (plasmid) [Herpetosiphon aurantiacus DSM 785]|uniref:Uncharacterized protein n=1 Tax=Herpetosiphon aurantiacus (strain ATCC 23779 / DSM 785 / 114-95) TaxID=316274 RepID=A9B954_HERA2|nr:hypothetical protein Haur_5241 [Herpetosiphon aurantiacus DSM 785]